MTSSVVIAADDVINWAAMKQRTSPAADSSASYRMTNAASLKTARRMLILLVGCSLDVGTGNFVVGEIVGYYYYSLIVFSPQR